MYIRQYCFQSDVQTRMKMCLYCFTIFALYTCMVLCTESHLSEWHARSQYYKQPSTLNLSQLVLPRLFCVSDPPLPHTEWIDALCGDRDRAQVMRAIAPRMMKMFGDRLERGLHLDSSHLSLEMNLKFITNLED